MSHDDRWCSIDPCEDCLQEQQEREAEDDRYYDELHERKHEKAGQDLLKAFEQAIEWIKQK